MPRVSSGRIFLYPAAVSLVVTGVVWKWILNPGTGIESFVRSLGFENFEFGWITSDKTVLYALVIAAVWQVAGFAMALFLASLRAVDQEIVKAARLDGGSAWRIYFHIILPSMRWTFVTVFVLLTAFALKTFDLVVAMTAGGPGLFVDLSGDVHVQHGLLAKPARRQRRQRYHSAGFRIGADLAIRALPRWS